MSRFQNGPTRPPVLRRTRNDRSSRTGSAFAEVRLPLRVLSWLLLGAILLCSATVQAQEAVAQSLFDEGKRLMARGKTTEACEKFAASEAAQPSTGALLNLAACHHKLGKTATAWAEFKEAVTRARADGRPDRVEFAQEQANQLEQDLCKIVLKAPKSVLAIEGLQISLGGTQLPPSSLGVSLPIDPGVHRLALQAPGYQPWSTSVTIVGKRKQHTVNIPALRPLAQIGMITVTTTDQNIHVELDGQKLNADQLGVAQKLALGKHTVRAVAPGFDEWSKSIELKSAGESYLLRVPKLSRSDEAVGEPEAHGPVGAERKSEGSSGHTIAGLVLAGVGAAGLGAGIVAGVVARNQAQTALDRRDLCPEFKCTEEGRAHIDAAEKNAMIATIAVPAGALTALVGVAFLVFGGEDDDSASSHWSTQVGQNNWSLNYRGEF